MEQVLKIINDHAAATGNLCGISLVQVSNRAKLSLRETSTILNTIHAEKKIRVREGIHGKLVFAAQKKEDSPALLTNKICCSNK